MLKEFLLKDEVETLETLVRKMSDNESKKELEEHLREAEEQDDMIGNIEHLKLGWCTILDLAALAMIDEAYLDKEEWIKKSICTTAKVSFVHRIRD